MVVIVVVVVVHVVVSEVYFVCVQVLTVPDKELNAWVSVKKMSQYR